MVAFPEQMYTLSLFPCLTHFVTTTGVWLWSWEKNILFFFLVLHFSELCLGSAGFREVGQSLSGPQDSTPVAGLAGLHVWWLLTLSGLSAASSVEPLAIEQPRKLCKRELTLHAVTIGRKCKCRHLCKCNPPFSLLNTFLPASWQSPLPFALFPRASNRKIWAKSLYGHHFIKSEHLECLALSGQQNPWSCFCLQALGYETLPHTERCKLEQKWEHTTHWNLSEGSVSPIAVALPPG